MVTAIINNNKKELLLLSNKIFLIHVEVSADSVDIHDISKILLSKSHELISILVSF